MKKLKDKISELINLTPGCVPKYGRKYYREDWDNNRQALLELAEAIDRLNEKK